METDATTVELDADADVAHEPDTDEHEPDGDEDAGTPKTAEEPAAALTEKDIERAMEKLEREAKRHRDRVSEIMGEDALMLIPCELCPQVTAGFRYPTPVGEEQKRAVLAAVGMGDVGNMRHSPDALTCDVCDGYGELISGSRVAAHLSIACQKCHALGYTTAQDREQWESQLRAQEAARQVLTQPQSFAISYDSRPAVDQWLRPQGHEFYGMDPQYLSPEARQRDWPAAQR